MDSDSKMPAAFPGGKNQDIEVLRAIAICGVVVFHANGTVTPQLHGAAQDWFAAGNFASGVDLFFAISGFVIARTLLPRLQGAPTPHARASVTLAFWTRRAFRVLPTAWLWLTFIVAVTAAFRFNTPFLSFQANLGAAIAGIFLFANFRYAATFGTVAYGATLQFWTLSLEEQFYLLLPFVALLSGRRWLPWVIALMAVSDLWRPNGIYLRLFQTGSLSFGVLIAIWVDGKSYARLAAAHANAPGWVATVLAVAAVAAIGLARLIGATNPLTYVAVAFAAGTCVLLASFNRDALCPPGPWRHLLLWIGARSYGLYVIHLPLFLVMQDLVLRVAPYPWSHWYSVGVLAIALIALAALAELNYRFIEMPLRRFGMRLAARIAGDAPATALTAAETSP